MGSTSKKPRVHYHPERRRIKKKNKVADLVKQFRILQQRKKVEGETKWIKNALQKLEIRMRKAGLKG
jgi:ABC-type uncharacterized transport system ATPase subunit